MNAENSARNECIPFSISVSDRYFHCCKDTDSVTIQVYLGHFLNHCFKYRFDTLHLLLYSMPDAGIAIAWYII